MCDDCRGYQVVRTKKEAKTAIFLIQQRNKRRGKRLGYQKCRLCGKFRIVDTNAERKRFRESPEFEKWQERRRDREKIGDDPAT